MVELKFHKENDSDGYWAVEDSDGVVRCSCGAELIKQDENKYRCRGGNVFYTLEEQDIVYDKNGTLMLRIKEH